MTTFYKNYMRLCELNGESLTGAAAAMGLQRSTVTRWRDRDSVPMISVRLAVADHFGVPVHMLDKEGAFDNGLPEKPADAPLEWAQDEVEAGARAARRCQIIDRTEGMTLAQLEQIIGLLDVMFPAEG